VISTTANLDDAVTAARIHQADADAVRIFAEFLRVAGPPDGHTLSRLEHRPDLLRFALAVDTD
jgi:hypothetical protein